MFYGAAQWKAHKSVYLVGLSASTLKPDQTMKAVKTVLSPVQEPGKPAGARYEWLLQ